MLSNCHGVMHTVGRTYALDEGLTLADLQDVLPRSNDPGCSAGFAHGLVTGVAPSIDPRQPREAAEVCADAGTRYRRYSCVHGLGHAFMRIYSDRLRPRSPSAARSGPARRPTAPRAPTTTTGSPSPAPTRRRCRPARPRIRARSAPPSRPSSFVRAGTARSSTTGRRGSSSTRRVYLDVLCRDLAGLQREACITGAAVIGPADPEEQLELCADLEDQRDAVACIRGTKAQNLLGASTAAYVRLLGRCELFAGATRAACYRWLGKTVAVLTDGASRDGLSVARARGRPPFVPGGRPRVRERARDVQLSLTMWYAWSVGVVVPKRALTT